MNKKLRNALTFSVSALMLLGTGTGLQNAVSNNNVHASSINVAYGTGFGKYVPWHHLHMITISHHGHGVGTAGSPERPSWFRKNGHTFHMDDQGDITRIDGRSYFTRSQLKTALVGSHKKARRRVVRRHRAVRRKARKRIRRHAKKSVRRHTRHQKKTYNVRNFNEGYNDENRIEDLGEPYINKYKYRNNSYRKGWIAARVHYDDDTSTGNNKHAEYIEANRLYNSGIHYIKSHNLKSNKYVGHDTWYDKWYASSNED